MLLVVCMLVVLFAACANSGGAAVPAPTVEPTSAPALEPTATFTPTSTPEPTATFTPTSTPEPTATSTPTPEPTSTPTPTPLEIPVYQENPSYQKGNVTENSFESEWMNLRFTVQKDMYMFTQAELDALMQQSANLMYGDEAGEKLDYAKLTTVTEMRAQCMGGAVVTVCTEKLPVLYYNTTAEQYLAAVIYNLQNQGTAVIESVGDFFTEEFAGEEYTCVQINLDYGVGYGISMEYMVRKVDTSFVGIVFTYATEYLAEGAQNLKRAFGSFNSEPVVLPEPTPYPSTYVMGTLSDASYESKWLNLRFDATEEVILPGRDEMEEMVPFGVTMIYGDQAGYLVDVTKQSVFYEMMALHIGGGNVLVQTEKLAPGCENLSVEDYLVIVMNQLKMAANVSYTIDETLYKVEVAGEKYLGFSTITDSFGEKTYQEFLCRKKENMFISLILTYQNDSAMDNVEYLLSLLKEYDTKSKEPSVPTITVEEEKNIIVGQYKGLTLTCVSQAEVDMEIATMLETYSELVAVDHAAEVGDTLNIDFVGKMDGVVFDGGTAEDYDLVLGSGTFIEGFEEGLIGAMAGEVHDLNLIFPENYGSAELAGQAVVFTVTVNAVMEKQVPDLTDEFIAREFPGYATVAEYIEAMRNSLNMGAFYEQITEQLMASSEVIKYNEADVELRKQSLIDLYTLQAEYYGSYYGLDTETSIQYFLGYESIAAFEEDMGVYAYDVEKNAMIIAEIADVEELEITEDVYSRKVAEMAAYYGYEDIAEFEDANGVDAIKESILSDLVMDFIIDNAIITEAE